MHDSVYFYSWITILVIYLVLYFALPISVLNSSNGFKSGFVVLIWSLVIFAVILMAYVVWNHSKSCESKRYKALHYLQGRKASLPKEFQSAVEVTLDKNIKNSKKPVQWNKLEPETVKPKKLPF